MRVITPQITWHNRDPVLCIDFDPTSPKSSPGSPQKDYYRLATGGADSHLLIWHLRDPNTMQPDLECVADLTRHNKAVNIVRFNSSGSHIASADDDAYIHIWKNDKSKSEEAWQVEKTLRRHLEDVADLSWSADGTQLVSASVDNSAVVWDIKKGMPLHIWSEHAGFVQGVSYDPLGEYIATMSTDRTLRMFNPKSGKVSLKAIKYPEDWLVAKAEDETMAKDENDSAGPSEKSKNSGRKSTVSACNRIFQDDTLTTFCRRLSFSPKGEFLVVPGGVVPPSHCKFKPENKPPVLKPKPSPAVTKGGKSKRTAAEKEKPESTNHAVIIFCRNSFTNPCAVIPTGTSFSIAARFSPVYYKINREVITYGPDFVNPSEKSERVMACVGKLKKRKASYEILMDMPYRLVFGVITNNSVIIGDTESSRPIAVIKNIHLARLSDLGWSADGRILFVTSTDGYCSIVSFAENELGIPAEEMPELCLESFPLQPVPVKEKVKKESKKKEPTKKELKKETKKEPKQKPVKDTKKKEVKAKEKLEVKDDGAAEAEKSAEAAESLKSSTAEKPKEKTPKGKPIGTPQRNTLDKWVIKIKTPNTNDTPTLTSTSPGTSASKCKNVIKPLSNGSPVKPDMDGASAQPLAISPNLCSTASDTTNPTISSDQIRKLENAPIIIDLDSDSEEEHATKLPSSSKVTQNGKQIETVSTKKEPTARAKVTDTLNPNSKSKSSPAGEVVTGEKRPATSPLTSCQNPKQPRRVQLITLSTPSTSGNKEEDPSGDK